MVLIRKTNVEIQASVGLAMTPAERLRWLNEAMETLRRWQGRARAGAAIPPRG